MIATEVARSWLGWKWVNTMSHGQRRLWAKAPERNTAPTRPGHSITRHYREPEASDKSLIRVVRGLGVTGYSGI